MYFHNPVWQPIPAVLQKGVCLQTEVEKYDDKYRIILNSLSNPSAKVSVQNSVGRYFDTKGNLVDEHLRSDMKALVKDLIATKAKAN
jgi:hypothetical protein